MRLTYEYTNALGEYLAQCGLCNPDAYHVARRLHHRMLVLPAWATLLGILTAIVKQDAVIAAAFMILVGLPLLLSLPFSTRYRKALEQSFGPPSATDLRLEVDDEGLHEYSDGIRTFVPWSSVRRFEVYHDTLFVALAANRWAIIPKNSLSESSDPFDDLVRALQEKTIGEVRR